MLSAVTFSLGLALSPAVHRPVLQQARPAQPVMIMNVVDAVKDSIIPDNTDKTLRNVFGYQALAWGIGGMLAPAYVCSNVLGVTCTPAVATSLRGMSLGNLCLAGRFCGGSDADAAATGVVWFTAWYKLCQAGVYGGYAPQLVTFNMLMALVAARRNGGIYKTVTNADTATLSSLLPRDYETSTRNYVGFQATGWGIGAVFFPAMVFDLLGLAVTPLQSALMTGIGLTNIVLGGKILGGTDSAAAANGVVFNGGWAVLLALGKSAGIFTGTYIPFLTAFNAAFALYCASKLM